MSSRIRLLPHRFLAVSVIVLLVAALLLPSGGVADATAVGVDGVVGHAAPEQQRPVPMARDLR